MCPGFARSACLIAGQVSAWGSLASWRSVREGSIVRTVSTSVAWNWTMPNRSRRSRLAQSLEQLPARPILRASESVRQVVPDGSVCRASVCASTVAVGPMTGSHQANVVGVGSVGAGCGVAADVEGVGSFGGVHGVSFRPGGAPGRVVADFPEADDASLHPPAGRQRPRRWLRLR